jgi:hypothetical protein
MTKKETVQVLPKWFDGDIYAEGEEVKNPYSGESCYLNNVELSMYDFIKGVEIIISSNQDDYNKSLTELFYEGLWWFKDNSPKAYIILLD